MKTVTMKTYGRRNCKFTAWMSPDDRKRAFDSSRSTDGDSSDYKPAKPTRRRKKTSSGRGIRPVKKKISCRKTATSSDEENINVPRRPRRQETKKTRKSPPASEPAVSTPDKQVLMTSNSENNSMLTHKYDKDHMKNSNVRPPSAGRFVTRRRRASTAKPQPPKARVTSLNSLRECSSGASGSSRILRPSRRRLPQTVIISSAESSMNAAETSIFAASPLQERSLNELSDHSLGPYTIKTIFCSTPAADPFSIRPRLKPFVINEQGSTPLSGSGSCVGVSNLFQEDVDSSQQHIASVHSASPTGLHFREDLQSDLVKTTGPNTHHLEEPSGDLFREAGTYTTVSCSEHAKSISDNTKTSRESPKTGVLCEDSESSSYFVSAAQELEWLIHDLKEKCLTKYCTVQLERLDILTVTQLCSQTTYSSCLGDEQSLQQPNKYSVSVNSIQTNSLQSSEASFNLHLSETNNENSADSLSVSSFDSPYQAASVTDSRRSRTHNFSPDDAVSSKQPNKRSRVAQTQCDDPESKRALLQNRCTTSKVSVNINRVTLSELNKSLTNRNTKMKLTTDVFDSSNKDRANGDDQSKTETDWDKEDTFSTGAKRTRTLTSSEDTGKDEAQRTSCDILPKRKKKPLAPKEKNKKSTTADGRGTSRKACVSGLSASRWQNKRSASTHLFRTRTASASVKAADSSINELMSTQYKQPTELGGTVNFATPVKAVLLNVSSLLADLTPNTHTWSRLKAAFSVHRKVLLTPRTPAVSNLDISRDLFATPLRTPLPKHLRSQLLSHDSLAVSVNEDLSDAEKVYHECGQECPLPWEECILPERMKKCVKIGEGTFGEVFSTTNASGDTVALKIIPLEGSEKVNGEDQKTFGEILHEIIISKELSSLKEKQQNQTCGFIGLNDLHCVQGSYPPDFLKAWDRFDKQKGSENDRPDFFEKDQFFVILEFEFGGTDLENSDGKLASSGAAMSILHQVTAALAVAEQELHFEHRDLHWGNILVKTTKEKSRSFTLNGTVHTIETKGVLVRIIDYSLSRLEIDELTVSCDISKDEELFMGQGDYQFEIYRLMRSQNGNNWADYHPHTNVLWLHYLCSKLLAMKYRGSRGKGAKDLREAITLIFDNILQYSSATEVLQNCPMFNFTVGTGQ